MVTTIYFSRNQGLNHVMFVGVHLRKLIKNCRFNTTQLGFQTDLLLRRKTSTPPSPRHCELLDGNINPTIRCLPSCELAYFHKTYESTSMMFMRFLEAFLWKTRTLLVKTERDSALDMLVLKRLLYGWEWFVSMHSQSWYRLIKVYIIIEVTVEDILKVNWICPNQATERARCAARAYRHVLSF